jgi:hypothetical protein
LKTIGHTDICSTCDLRERFAEIPETERLAIQAAAEQGEGSGVFPAHGILGWSLSDVISLVRMVRSERGVWGNG